MFLLLLPSFLGLHTLVAPCSHITKLYCSSSLVSLHGSRTAASIHHCGHSRQLIHIHLPTILTMSSSLDEANLDIPALVGRIRELRETLLQQYWNLGRRVKAQWRSWKAVNAPAIWNQ